MQASATDETSPVLSKAIASEVAETETAAEHCAAQLTPIMSELPQHAQSTPASSCPSQCAIDCDASTGMTSAAASVTPWRMRSTSMTALMSR